MSATAGSLGQRFSTVASAFLTLVGSWYWLQVVHELGHVVVAPVTGGHVKRILLDFSSFSRTDVDPNPYPLAVAWGGPAFGTIVPVLLWLLARQIRLTFRGLLAFFAGFCLVANGAYIGVGSFGRVGDAGDLLDHGAPAMLLWAFGLVCMSGGLWIWHILGRRSETAGCTSQHPRPLVAPMIFAGAAAMIVSIVRWAMN